jgi:hypothetical protein
MTCFSPLRLHPRHKRFTNALFENAAFFFVFVKVFMAFYLAKFLNKTLSVFAIFEVPRYSSVGCAIHPSPKLRVVAPAASQNAKWSGLFDWGTSRWYGFAV